MIRFAIHCPPEPSYLRLAKQMGLTDIVTSPPRSEPGPVQSQAAWVQLRQQVEAAGLTLSVIESIPMSDRIKLGQPGRDEDIDAYRQSVRAMGAAGIPILCYNWMAVLFVLRTSATTRVRGEALSISYEHALSERGPVPPSPVPVTEELLWANLAYFLRAVVPVAEEAGVKLAMHPDDPPISPSRGVARILTSPAAFQRLLDLVPSPNNGMTYCQGCFSEMCADVPATIRHFAAQGKLHFAHFRHVRGPLTDFVEVFHDERGNVDMFEAMKAYHESGFDGPMRPDHLPVMEGAAGDPFAEHMWGRLLAVGYMKGLAEGIRKAAGKEER
jgi:mannonate dehydratase